MTIWTRDGKRRKVFQIVGDWVAYMEEVPWPAGRWGLYTMLKTEWNEWKKGAVKEDED